MKARELFNKHYNELTQKARNVITTSDQSFDEWAGEFSSAEAFNAFIDENFEEVNEED